MIRTENTMYTVTTAAPQDPVDRVTPRLLIGPGDEGCKHLAAVRIDVPAGGRMGGHAHGDSETLLTLLSGQVVVRSGEQTGELSPGGIAHVAVGEKVEVENPGSEPAALLAVFSPPDFAARIPRWTPAP
ncbi:cupin domain-containing protein [Actinomadura sp. 9N407]|uniref:cupin domain-containing protein n=1 Tax=Actinomadura sp. 9N407 TaxID=3375154 RepID=UPI0037AF148B